MVPRKEICIIPKQGVQVMVKFILEFEPIGEIPVTEEIDIEIP